MKHQNPNPRFGCRRRHFMMRVDLFRNFLADLISGLRFFKWAVHTD